MDDYYQYNPLKIHRMRCDNLNTPVWMIYVINIVQGCRTKNPMGGDGQPPSMRLVLAQHLGQLPFLYGLADIIVHSGSKAYLSAVRAYVSR